MTTGSEPNAIETAAPAPGIAGMLGRRLGTLVHSGMRLRRDLVERQIARSFPERDADWVGQVARACYRHFGEEFALLASGPRAVRRAVERVEAPGAIESLYRLTDGTASCVVVSGHLGNWELAGAYMAARGVPVTAVARRQSGGFGRRLHELRRSAGLQVLDHDGGAAPVLRALRDGRCVTLVADQHALKGAEPIPFFGRPAWTRLGPARLARAAGVPLVFGALVRDGEGYRGEWRPIPPEALGPGDAVTATRAWLSLLEDAVKRRPEQYFWFHRRWKHMGKER